MVSLTINPGLFAQAKSFGINVSQVAEDALAREVAARKAALLTFELRQDLEACNAYAAKHGSFAEMVREHYQGDGRGGVNQFDVFENPVLRARRAYPLVAVLQSNLAETGRDRIVAPVLRERLRGTVGRLTPHVTVAGVDHVLLVPSMTAMLANDLREPRGYLVAYRNQIVKFGEIAGTLAGDAGLGPALGC